MPLEERTIALQPPVGTGPTDRATFERVVGRGPEVIDSPDGAALPEFYAMLARYFRPGEVEPLAQFRRELLGNHMPGRPARFFGVVLRDPAAGDGIISGMYGSVHHGVLALRFKITVPGYRGTGISQEVDRILFGVACGHAERQGQPLWSCFGECVERSESYLNRTWRMRRLYVPGATPGSLEEVYYQLPHLGDWTPDGNPANPEPTPIREHLQIAAAPYPEAIPMAELEAILVNVWQDWYVLPPDAFSSRAAWERHRDFVMLQTLEETILAPLRRHPAVKLFSRDERERLNRHGVTVRDLSLHDH